MKKIIILTSSLIVVIAGLLIIDNKFNLKAEFQGNPLLIINKFCEDPTNSDQRGCIKFISNVLAEASSTYQSVGGAVGISGDVNIGPGGSAGGPPNGDAWLYANPNLTNNSSVLFIGNGTKKGWNDTTGSNGGAMMALWSNGAWQPGLLQLMSGTNAPIEFWVNSDGVMNNAMKVSSSGEVTIAGNTGAYGPLTLKNSAQVSTNLWRMGPDSGNNFIIYNQNNNGPWLNASTGSGTGGGWNYNSDQRLKKNIQALSTESGLAAIEKLNPVSFNWLDSKISDTSQNGFIAQDVQKILPQLVSSGPDTTITLSDGSKQTISKALGINYDGFIPPLVKAVQELNQNYETLSQKVRKQEEQIKALQKQIEELKQK